ncbi:MAG: hypothetical protein ACI83D_000329 [Planctomycetota bacterium]|jgi:hypothetical protein
MDPEFVDGLIIKAPRQGAPDFVKGSISIKREELLAWLSQKTEEWINLDIKVSKAGKWYSQVNTWKPSNEGEGAPAVASSPSPSVAPSAVPGDEEPLPAIEYPEADIQPEDIPF